MELVSLVPARDKVHKYKAHFVDSDGRKKTTAFGAYGMKDYILYQTEGRDVAEEHKKMYLTRHSARENWNDPTSAGALSRWILWNLPTLKASLADYRRRVRDSHWR